MIEPERALRRILVAVDAATLDLPSIECVVELASRLEAELIGLFVEDDALLRMAALPGARRISFLTGAEEGFDVASTERELRGMAAGLQRQLAASSERSSVRCSFRVVRGHLIEEVVRAAAEVDMLVVSRSSRPLRTHVRLKATVRAAAEVVPASVLVLPALARIEGPVRVPYDASPEANEILRTAATLTGRSNGILEILVFPDTVEHAHRLEREARAQIEGRAVALLCRTMPRNVSAVRGLLQRSAGNLLVLGEGDAPHLSAEIRELAEQLDVPVLLVRRPRRGPGAAAPQ